ncbi:hypothetical protein C5167_003615 [Papaver somniferum]|uniref:Uncharacterized protein n=1 Tax=Papaver somniferum TaxID=3469 RepID=A0A4Y7L455_PAPSO|nr:hypothetical protein C5167_003615 [Papaver somniferum]
MVEEEEDEEIEEEATKDETKIQVVIEGGNRSWSKSVAWEE